MYSQDSFFDLTPLGQVGLATVSGVLCVTTLIASWVLLHQRPAWVRPIGALMVYYLFVWLSPQVYYQYFHLLFDFLPNQWVVFPPPNPIRLFEFLTFTGPQSLAGHGQGLLGWALIVVPFLNWRMSILQHCRGA